MVKEDDGWWWWVMRDGLTHIGPYSDEDECRADFARYECEGRMSRDAAEPIGPKCADCE